MSFSYAPDFVFKRKRNRLSAIDPSLGFYPASSPQPDATPLAFPNQQDNIDNDKLQPSGAAKPVQWSQSTQNRADQALAEPTTSAACVPQTPYRESKSDRKREVKDNQNQVTVEGFLRWSAGASSKKLCSRKRRYVQLNKHTQDQSENLILDPEEDLPRKRRRSTRVVHQGASDDDYRPSEEEAEEERPESTRKRAPRRPSKGSLAQRMLRAAVLSHVDIEGGNAIVETNDHRSLKFVSKYCGSPSGRSKPAKWRLVDPRKVASTMRPPDFPLLQSASAKAGLKYQRITSWHPSVAAVNGRSMRRERKVIQNGVKVPTAPMKFVALKEHEAAVNAIFHTSIPSSMRAKGIPMEPLTLEPPSLEATSFVGQEKSTSPCSLRLVALDIDDIINSPLHGFSSQPDTPISVPVLSSSSRNALGDARYSLESGEHCFSPASQQSEPFSALTLCSSPSSHILTPSVTSSPEQPCSNSVPCSIPIAKPNAIIPLPTPTAKNIASVKPLKPFASFLDQFMETARHATLTQESKQRTAPRRSRPRPSTVQWTRAT